LTENFPRKKHFDYIASKAARRQYSLRVLKCLGLPHDQLLHTITAVIRPVLEYYYV